MMKETNADLEREALRLIAEGKMPTFEELVKVIAETREKYRCRVSQRCTGVGRVDSFD